MPTLEEIKARREKITPGEWYAFAWSRNGPKDLREGQLIAATSPGQQIRAETRGGVYSSRDQDFIANSPSDIDWLISQLESAAADMRERCAKVASEWPASQPRGIGDGVAWEYGATSAGNLIAQSIRELPLTP